MCLLVSACFPAHQVILPLHLFHSSDANPKTVSQNKPSSSLRGSSLVFSLKWQKPYTDWVQQGTCMKEARSVLWISAYSHRISEEKWMCPLLSCPSKAGHLLFPYNHPLSFHILSRALSSFYFFKAFRSRSTFPPHLKANQIQWAYRSAQIQDRFLFYRLLDKQHNYFKAVGNWYLFLCGNLGQLVSLFPVAPFSTSLLSSHSDIHASVISLMLLLCTVALSILPFLPSSNYYYCAAILSPQSLSKLASLACIPGT